MVKASRYTTLAVAALFLAAACTQQDPGSTYRDDPDAVRISAQVGDEEKSGNFATRSNPVPVSYIPGEELSFNSGDKVCVTADGQPAVVYTLQDGSTVWSPEEGKYLKWNTPTMSFTAWYPAAEGVNADNFTVPADQSNADKIAAADYMTCSQQITRDGDNPVTLSFQRRMARIMVHPTFNNQFNDEYSITEVSVCGNTNGYSGGSPASGSVEVKAYNNGTFYALLSPTTASSETFIKVKVEKNDGTEEYSLEAKGIIATEAGKSYNVDLKVGKNVASVSRVTVLDWSFKDSITGSEADQIPYLTFSAEGSQTFTMDFQPINNSPFDPSAYDDGGYFEYSVGNGAWVRFTETVENIRFGGDLGNLRLRGKCSRGTAYSDYGTPFSRIRFGNYTPVACTGDIRTLVDYKNYTSANTENARFVYLFYDCSQLTSAPDLPATKLAEYCYASMFKGCSDLTEAPELPATTLAEYCYASMFEGCTSLSKAPELPATELRSDCYDSMFKGCTSLSKAPELPATQLEWGCYANMFYQCHNLTEAPELPATRFNSKCYTYMFYECRALTKAPELPANNLFYECYSHMFERCVALTEAPELPATQLAHNCYAYMFSTCENLTETPELPATYLLNECYSHMFEYCRSLTEAELPAEQLTDGCYSNMFLYCYMLSKVTMKAKYVSSNYLTDWLEGAGFGADSRTLTLANSDVYNYLNNNYCLYDNWKKGNATIILLDGSTINDDPSTD